MGAEGRGNNKDGIGAFFKGRVAFRRCEAAAYGTQPLILALKGGTHVFSCRVILIYLCRVIKKKTAVMTPDTKEKIQYSTAVMMIVSAVVLAFICFFLNHYKIEDSVLWYIAQALVYAASIFGISLLMTLGLMCTYER